MSLFGKQLAVPETVRKRDGKIVPFTAERIDRAVTRALTAAGEDDRLEQHAMLVTERVVKELGEAGPWDHPPKIEYIQDLVEKHLMLLDFVEAAKAFILYRAKRAEVRQKKNLVPANVQNLALRSRQYFKDPLGEFIFYRSYSRWIEDEGRRETWIETVNRYVGFMRSRLGSRLNEEEYEEIRVMILSLQVMPSMRLMWAAGAAAEYSNATAYNCSYIAPTRIEDFAEIMYLSMCGCGVGFSVETQTVQQLPIVHRQVIDEEPKVYVVEDSKEGWGDALTHGLTAWFGGRDVTFDYSKLRPAGARLKIMGGRSSGPEALKMLLDKSRRIVLSRQGRRLANIDVHDLICTIGEAVVMGGVRRTALISISDLDDRSMQKAKTGQFWHAHPERQMSNNSASYVSKPSAEDFLGEWLALIKSGTGERGIFNREGLPSQLPSRRYHSNTWPQLQTMGPNPCGEIYLRSKQFCNLTEVVARPEDTVETLHAKIRVATILGTYQSMLTDFPYISSTWKSNCEEERLLGVSITGQWDCPLLLADKEGTLRFLRNSAIEINKDYAKRFGVRPSMAVTCVKPSGTVSQLVGAASGMHPRWAPHYLRRVRISATDPLFHMLKEQKWPYHPETGQSVHNASTFVLDFPVKSPPGSPHRNQISARTMLEYWLRVKTKYTEHNPSVTIQVAPEEWISVARWLYDHWGLLGGLSFLPKDDHVYQLAPFEEITEEQYETTLTSLPDVDYSQIMVYEEDDQTEGAKEAACSAGICEL
jgi:ribonucleoside-diphosphate reductase alpha chain